MSTTTSKYTGGSNGKYKGSSNGKGKGQPAKKGEQGLQGMRKVRWGKGKPAKDLPKAGLRRLCLRAGCTRISRKVYPFLSSWAINFLASVINNACAVADLHKRCTLKLSDGLYGLKKRGDPMLADEASYHKGNYKAKAMPEKRLR